MHYAVEGHTILELRALCLPMNALCRIVEIGCTISEIRADCLYLAGKRCIPEYITSIIPESRQQETGRILRNARLQSLPYNRTTSFRQAFIPSTTRLWNSLLDFLHVDMSMTTFKKSITNYLSVPKPPVYYG